jgi:hypothetical protein
MCPFAPLFDSVARSPSHRPEGYRTSHRRRGRGAPRQTTISGPASAPSWGARQAEGGPVQGGPVQGGPAHRAGKFVEPSQRHFTETLHRDTPKMAIRGCRLSCAHIISCAHIRDGGWGMGLSFGTASCGPWQIATPLRSPMERILCTLV